VNTGYDLFELLALPDVDLAEDGACVDEVLVGVGEGQAEHGCNVLGIAEDALLLLHCVADKLPEADLFDAAGDELVVGAGSELKLKNALLVASGLGQYLSLAPIPDYDR